MMLMKWKIDALMIVLLCCNYSLLENAHNVEEIRDEIMESVNVDANE